MRAALSAAGLGCALEPYRLGFEPLGGEFSALGLKKLSRLSHVQSTVEPGLTHKATGPRVRVGQGFGDFLGLL